MGLYHEHIQDRDSYNDSLKWILRTARRIGVHGVAFQGLSGTGIGMVVAHRLNVPWAYVRKENENALVLSATTPMGSTTEPATTTGEEPRQGIGSGRDD